MSSGPCLVIAFLVESPCRLAERRPIMGASRWNSICVPRPPWWTHNPPCLGPRSRRVPLPPRHWPFVLIAFGAGLGLSAVSPWSDSGVSAATFKTGTGIYLVIVAVMSSAVGGYLAARLRTKWANVHSNEVFFRDTAHGFLAWAFATLLSASVLSSAAAYLANGAVAGISGAASQVSTIRQSGGHLRR